MSFVVYLPLYSFFSSKADSPLYCVFFHFYFTYLFAYAYFFFLIFVSNSLLFFLVFQYLFLFTSSDNSLGSPILMLYPFSSISTLCLPLISMDPCPVCAVLLLNRAQRFQFLQLVAYLGNKTLA